MLLEKVGDKQIIIYIMAVVTVIGALAEMIARRISSRVLREARDIHQSTHPLMKLVKAKYEHANLVTERVQNVDVFVDKYLYEYRVMGMKCHGWQRLGIKLAWVVYSIGILGAAILYLNGVDIDKIIEVLLYGLIGGTVLFLLHILLGEQQKLIVARAYIVDYLENVCAHRNTKTEIQTNREERQKEEQNHKPATEMRIREILEEFLA